MGVCVWGGDGLKREITFLSGVPEVTWDGTELWAPTGVSVCSSHSTTLALFWSQTLSRPPLFD